MCDKGEGEQDEDQVKVNETGGRTSSWQIDVVDDDDVVVEKGADGVHELVDVVDRETYAQLCADFDDHV